MKLHKPVHQEPEELIALRQYRNGFHGDPWLGEWIGGDERIEVQGEFNRVRHFDAATGHFLSDEPIGFEGGDEKLTRYVGEPADEGSE